MYVSKQTTLVSLVMLATGVSLGYAISNSSATDPVPSQAKNTSSPPPSSYNQEAASAATIAPTQKPQQQLSEIPIPEVPEMEDSGYQFEWQQSLERQLGHDPLQNQASANAEASKLAQPFFGKAPKTSFNQTMGLSEDGSASTIATAPLPRSSSTATESAAHGSSPASQPQNSPAATSYSYSNSQQVAAGSGGTTSPSYSNRNSQQVAAGNFQSASGNNSQHPQVRSATGTTVANNQVAPTAPQMSASQQPQLARSRRLNQGNSRQDVRQTSQYKGTAADLMPQPSNRRAIVANNSNNSNPGVRTDSTRSRNQTPSNTETTANRGQVVAPDRQEISSVRSQLDSIAAPSEVREELRGSSPGLTIAVPSGFGADRNTLYTSATYQSETRFSDVEDGAAAIGFGFGNADEAVGVELSYTMASFGRNRDFGSGGFNLKVHRRLPGDVSVAAGWNGFLNFGDDNDFEDSLYGSASKVFRLKDDIDKPFSRVAVTAGIGNGQFRTEEAVDEDEAGVNAFGSLSVRVARPVSAIVEWTGQDLSLGASVTPFENIPITITPAVRDVAGAGDEPRFVLGVGMGYQF
jgi:hypothetical protein